MIIDPYRFSTGGDPYWSNVVALLHMDGTNGSTSFPDQTGKVWTIAGAGFTVSTSSSQFGQSAVESAGTNSYISTPSTSDFAFGTDPFTIEFWANLTILPSSFFKVVLGNWSSGAANSPWCLFYATSGVLQFQMGSSVVASPTSTYTSNSWHSVAITRDISSTVRIFYDGNIVASGTVTDNCTSTTPLRIGANNTASTDRWSGFIDEVRITKGICRYTTNYIPATAPFPNYS